MAFGTNDWRDDSSWRPLFGDFEGLFGDRREARRLQGAQRGIVPPADIEDRGDSYLITLDVPGIPQDEVHVEIDGRQLVVSGERKYHEHKGLEKTHMIERQYGSFRRAFLLPDDVRLDAVSADYDSGVLTITVPKREELRPRKVSIGARGAEQRLGTGDETFRAQPSERGEGTSSDVCSTAH